VPGLHELLLCPTAMPTDVLVLVVLVLVTICLHGITLYTLYAPATDRPLLRNDAFENGMMSDLRDWCRRFYSR
jgi:hypothetical protein